MNCGHMRKLSKGKRNVVPYKAAAADDAYHLTSLPVCGIKPETVRLRICTYTKKLKVNMALLDGEIAFSPYAGIWTYGISGTWLRNAQFKPKDFAYLSQCFNSRICNSSLDS